MPYIPLEERKAYDPQINILIHRITEKGISRSIEGDVAYVIFKIMKRVYGHGRWGHRTEALKILESVKHEFQRRFIDPYEDEKLRENGDVT